MRYLIGYDISDNKRLQRIYRRMTRFATPLQYSLFIFEGNRKQLDESIKPVLKLFNSKEDDLRIYPLPKNGKHWQLGKSALPEGIVWGVLLG